MSSGQHLTSTPQPDHGTGFPQDPFLEHNAMFVPEETQQVVGAATNQQDDIYEDIVANTNPDLIDALPSRDQVAMATLYTTEVDGFFRVKQHLMEQRRAAHARSSSPDRLYMNRRNLVFHDAEDMLLSDKEGYEEFDEQNISDFGGDENTAMILDMMNGQEPRYR